MMPMALNAEVSHHPDSQGDIDNFFAVSLDLLVIRDLRGVVVKISASCAGMLGYMPSEIEGRLLLALVHPDDLPGTWVSAREVEERKPGDPVQGYINRYRHKQGHYRTLEWRAQRWGDRIYGVARDVTDRVAAEAEIAASRAAAEAGSRAKSDFLANMSHEIRTPLNGVIGIVDALCRTALSPEQAAMVELIRDSGTTLERLVSDILDVSKIEAGQLDLELQSFDLEEALSGTIDLMRAKAAEKDLAFIVAWAPEVGGAFIGDSMRLRQIVGNLLSNAVKFTSRGSVTLRVRLDSANDPPYLVLEVEDTGVGFDPACSSALFDRFSQADTTITRRFGGTGLGLPICRSLAQMMGGDVEAWSTPGVGSRFTARLALPQVPTTAPASARRAAPSTVSSTPDQPLRVLLAEDHPTNQRVVQLILDGIGADLTIVGDGAQAVAAAQRQTFDLILMDMQMPGMDGLAATRAIRADQAKSGGRTPIVMLSANAMPEHRQAAVSAGADLHVPKPITAARLLAGMETVLGG